MKLITKNEEETRKLAALLAKELLNSPISTDEAFAVALRGDLGAGKTTFAQGFAKGLGVKDRVKSPTFVIVKRYKLRTKSRFKYLYHIDCYRLKNYKDARSIGLPEILKDPENLALIEWPERVGKLLPEKSITISFSNINETTRKISFN